VIFVFYVAKKLQEYLTQRRYGATIFPFQRLWWRDAIENRLAGMPLWHKQSCVVAMNQDVRNTV